MFWLLFWVLVVGGLFVWFLRDATKPTPWPTKPLPVTRQPPARRKSALWLVLSELGIPVAMALMFWGHGRDGCDY